MKRSLLTKLIIFLLLIICILQIANAGQLTGSSLMPYVRGFERALRNEPDVEYDKVWFFAGYVQGVYESSSGLYSAPSSLTGGHHDWDGID